MLLLKIDFRVLLINNGIQTFYRFCNNLYVFIRTAVAIKLLIENQYKNISKNYLIYQ